MYNTTKEPYHNESQRYLYKYDPLTEYFDAAQRNTKYKSLEDTEPFGSDFMAISKYINLCSQHSLTGVPLKQRIMTRDEIVSLVQDGFNALIYGYGSKFNLLHDIGEQLSRQNPQLIIMEIKGFKPNLSFRNFINVFKEQLKLHCPNLKDGEQKMSFLDVFAQESLKVVLLVHSIDGKKLLQDDFLQFFKRASQLAGIKIIASFDNHRFSQLLTIENAYFLQFNTYAPYQNEMTPMLMQQTQGAKQAEGFQYVMKSLNPNQRDIVKLLAKILVKNKLPDGPTFAELFSKCVNKAILSSKVQLKENLQELHEHNIIILKRERYTMPYPMPLLAKISQGEF